MKTDSEMGITIPLSKVLKRVAAATGISRRNLCWIWKEGENVETVVTMAFSTPCKLKPKFYTKCILDNFDEAVFLSIFNLYKIEAIMLYSYWSNKDSWL